MQRGVVNAIDIGSDESVGTREVTFTFSMSVITHSYINSRLLVLPCVGLVVVCTRQGFGGRRLV